MRTLLGGGDAGQRFVVMELRLPQTVVAVAVGAALGLAGALTQTVARNAAGQPRHPRRHRRRGDRRGGRDRPRRRQRVRRRRWSAAPLQELGLPLAAFIGAMTTAALLYAFSWRRGLDIQRLVLVGIGLGATLTAGTSYLLVNARIQDAASAQVWLSGSLTARGWEHVRPVLLDPRA